MKKVSLWELFWTFFKIGAFTFGGGYAMIAILEQDLVENKKWISSADMMDMIIIAESTPGVIAVNMATSIGYRKSGVLGSIIATLGVTLPSFLMILALSFAVEEFSGNHWYKAAFAGIRCCVVTLIANAFLKVSKQMDKDVFCYVLLVTSFAIALLTNFNVIYLIIIGGVVGVIITMLKPQNKSDLPLASQPTEQIDTAPSNKEDNV